MNNNVVRSVVAIVDGVLAAGSVFILSVSSGIYPIFNSDGGAAPVVYRTVTCVAWRWELVLVIGDEVTYKEILI
jgi:hypothetical protein